MSKTNQRNHLLFELIAPLFQQILLERVEGFGRVSFTRVELSKDGKYLDLFIFTEQNPIELRKKMTDFTAEIQRHIAQSKVIGKMPILRFKLDITAGGERSVQDILAEIRTQYDLS